MKVLIVDAFLSSWSSNTGARMKSSFDVFEATVRAALKKGVKEVDGAEVLSTANNNALIEVVAVEDLDARVLLCDWETDAIEQKHRRALGHFDSFDIIFVGGDSNHSPFDARLKNLLILSKMAYYADKPYISVGVPALVDVVSICSKGTHLDVVGAGKLSALRKAKHDSPKAAYCDVETGDLYCYSEERHLRAWRPILNTGLHVESRNVQTAPKLKVSEKFPRSVEQRTRNTSMESDSATLIDRDVLVKVETKLQTHFALDGLSNGNLTFLATRLRHWVVNRTISPPDIACIAVPLAVLAEGPTSPILLEFGNRLLYCAEVNTGKTRRAFRAIVENFARHHVKKLVHSASGYISKSIMRFVLDQRFLVSGEGGPCPPISKSTVPSSGTGVVKGLPVSAASVGPSVASATTPVGASGKSLTLDPYRYSSSRTINPPSPRLTHEQRMQVGAFGTEDECGEDSRLDAWGQDGGSTLKPRARSTGGACYSIKLDPNDRVKGEGRMLHLMVDVCGLDSANSASLVTAASPEAHIRLPCQQQPLSMEPAPPAHTQMRPSAAALNRGRKNKPSQAVRISSSVAVGETGTPAAPSDAGGPVPETCTEDGGNLVPRIPMKTEDVGNLVPRIPQWHKVVAINEQSSASRGWLPHASPRIANESGFAAHPSASLVSPASVLSGTSSAVATATGNTSTVSVTSRTTVKSNYRRLVRDRKVQTARETAQEYKGLYTEPYQTAYEKGHSSREDKSRWVGDPQGFRSAFGSRSPLPLRQEGAVRAFGAYPEQGNEFLGIKASDAIALRRTEKAKWVSDKPWRAANR